MFSLCLSARLALGTYIKGGTVENTFPAILLDLHPTHVLVLVVTDDHRTRLPRRVCRNEPRPRRHPLHLRAVRRNVRPALLMLLILEIPAERRIYAHVVAAYIPSRRVIARKACISL